jgi:hypothetical protein
MADDGLIGAGQWVVGVNGEQPHCAAIFPYLPTPPTPR